MENNDIVLKSSPKEPNSCTPQATRRHRTASQEGARKCPESGPQDSRSAIKWKVCETQKPPKRAPPPPPPLLFFFLLLFQRRRSTRRVQRTAAGLDTCACHRVYFTRVSAFLTTRRKNCSCSGFLHGLPLCCQTFEWFVIQPGCCDGHYCIRSSRRVAHVRCTGQYTADFFFCFFAGVIAPVMSTSRSLCGFLHREVRHLVPRVHLLAHAELCKGPWSLRGPRGDGNGDRSLAWPSCTQSDRRFLLSLVQFRGPWRLLPYVPAGFLLIHFVLEFSYLLLDSGGRHLHYGIGAFWDRSLTACIQMLHGCSPVRVPESVISYFALLCTRNSRLKLTRPTSCKCVLMIRSRAIVVPVETSSSRIMPWHSVSPCDLRCPAATRGYGGSTPSYGLRFGLVGTFPTVVLSLSILAASLSHAVSVREDGHSRSRSSSDTGTVCATPSSCPLA